MDTIVFDLDEHVTATVGRLTITTPSGVPTTWVWDMAGPGHDVTIAQRNRQANERLAEERAQQFAQVNGRKYKPPVRTADEERQRTAKMLAERVLNFTPVKLQGEVVNFSPEAALRILLDPKLGWVFDQVLQYLIDERAFTQSSAAN